LPEGIAIAVPCISARPDSPWLAFWLASISGLAEPVGALVALLVLQNTKLPLENVLACVAGVMTMVALLELYPEAIRQQQQQIQQQQKDGPLGPRKESSVMTVIQSYNPIIWGSLVGMGMMVATEWYLPA
jgi:zinc transporter ZupT